MENHPLKNEFCNWLFKWLGLLYMEEKFGKDDPKMKEEALRLQKISVREMENTLEKAKGIDWLKDDPFLNGFRDIFDKHEMGKSEIEKAKELLEKSGYRIEKT